MGSCVYCHRGVAEAQLNVPLPETSVKTCPAVPMAAGSVNVGVPATGAAWIVTVPDVDPESFNGTVLVTAVEETLNMEVLPLRTAKGA